MKKIFLTLVVGVYVLALGSNAEAGALVRNRLVDISFDGFCDGMHLIINQKSGIVTGVDTGCVSDPLIGTVGTSSKLGAGINVMSRTFLYVIDDFPQKWSLYTADGTLVQTGTYTVGVAVAAPRRATSATGDKAK